VGVDGEDHDFKIFEGTGKPGDSSSNVRLTIDNNGQVSIGNGRLKLGAGPASSTNTLPEIGLGNTFHHLLMLEDTTGELVRTDTVAQVVIESPTVHNPDNDGGLPQSRATASAIIRSDGKIIGIRVVDGGGGYGDNVLDRPSVSILGGGGTGATAEVVQATSALVDRKIVYIKVTDQGSGYHSVGMIKPEEALEVSDILETNLGNWDSTGVATITTPLILPYGAGYTSPPTLKVGDDWVAGATYAIDDLIAAPNGILYKVAVAGDAGNTAPVHIIKGQTKDDADSNSTVDYTCMGPKATAVAIIDDQQVTQLAIIQCGDGYDSSSPPLVTVDNTSSGCLSSLTTQTVSSVNTTDNYINLDTGHESR